jgi:hypothetical protein
VARTAVPTKVERQLAELERQRGEGEISELTFTVQRNLLVTRAEQTARRRAAASRIAPPPAPAPPPPRDSARARRASARPRRATAAMVEEAPERGTPPPWSGLRRRPVAWLLAIAVVTGVVALAIHLGGSSPTASANSKPSVAATPTGSAPAASPSSSRVTLDETQGIPGGGSATLVGYSDHFTPGSVINNPLPAGGFYAAVELRVCAGSQASLTVSPFDYSLMEPDGSQVSVASGPAEGVQPQLQLTQLAPGQCVSGWLSYGVSAAPTQLSDSAASLTWSIP